MKEVLLVVDAQEGYAQEIKNEQEKKIRSSRLKELLKSHFFDLKIATLDWFPRNSQGEDKAHVVQRTESAFCIEETKEAEFLNDLDIDYIDYFIFKGKLDLAHGEYTENIVKKILNHVRYTFDMKTHDVSGFKITLCGIGRPGVIRDLSESLVEHGVTIQVDVDGCPFKEVFSIEHGKSKWAASSKILSPQKTTVLTDSELQNKRSFL